MLLRLTFEWYNHWPFVAQASDWMQGLNSRRAEFESRKNWTSVQKCFVLYSVALSRGHFRCWNFSDWSLITNSFNYWGILFCSTTSLPLATTRWVQSTCSSHCLLPTKQHCGLTSATSTIFYSEKNLGLLGTERAAGSRSKYTTIVPCCLHW